MGDIVRKTGGLIVAAGQFPKKSKLDPLYKIGSITVIRREVLTFQIAGLFPIVVVVGYHAEDIEHQLSDYGVIFIRNEDYENTKKFDSVKMGLKYMKDRCDKIVYTPVNVPMVTPDTIQKMVQLDKTLIVPSYHGHTGRPVLLDRRILPDIINYEGPGGLKGAIDNFSDVRTFMEVEDEGVIHTTDDIKRLEQLVPEYNKQIAHPFLRINLERESMFFDARSRLLLVQIQETHSVREACSRMAVSYSKAWTMLNKLEDELGYAVVERIHGGHRGGNTYLTKKGEEFLERYIEFENNVRRYTEEEYKRLF